MGLASRLKAKLGRCPYHQPTNGPWLTCGLDKGHDKGDKPTPHYDVVLKRSFTGGYK